MTLQIWKPKTRKDYFPTVFDEFFTDFMTSENHGFVPPIDVMETREMFLIKADLPGMEKKDIKISLKKGVLSISGERRENDEERNYYRKEIKSGSFCRSFNLGETIDQEKIKADFKNGQLFIELPKLPEIVKRDEARTININ